MKLKKNIASNQRFAQVVRMFNIQHNIGPKNRTARLLAGVILILLGLMFLNQGVLPLIGIVLGVIFILEAVFSYCILHGLRGTKDMR